VVNGEAMSLEAGERGGADCLLDCLREVRLHQFAGNFATRGITDCARLAALERQQFATYGITSPADSRRLTRLIRVIRDLRADGLLCRHGADRNPAAAKPDSSRRTSSVPGDLWHTSDQRCQKKQMSDRRAVDDTANTSTLPGRPTTDTRSKTAAPYRRPTRDAQRPRRGVKRATSTADGQLSSRLSVGGEAQYDGPTSFSPFYQRTVSHLPTHVQQVT